MMRRRQIVSENESLIESARTLPLSQRFGSDTAMV
jgi:hypothetical protein